ncbi:hypothetical protein IFT84_10405 [Rhizobium sp. CFBP 8762]|uniref:DUF6492 family protein n=1 Tax=Rhizobium sp. CFBP 8762 TaxID=2775279 RepID=UPI0017859F27|nr:DUF6492 family protein [Rhizobium sp. CFBP 8762]MBD8554935.1 hypothetical protein [Rhizobium sp. CFBP 8762]
MTIYEGGTAVVTASYPKDFERCQILCESMDRRLQGNWTHYLLVASSDVKMFKQLEGERRVVVDERELLPWWIIALPEALAYRGKRRWLTPYSRPKRGWHIQQLRRMAFARYATERTMLFIDSDVMMVREFDPAFLWVNGSLRLYREDTKISIDQYGFIKWVNHASHLLGLDAPPLPAHDYVGTIVAWDVETCRKLLDSIEARHQCHWVRAMLASREFSECMIYGRFVDDSLGTQGHYRTNEALCHVLWDNQTVPMNETGIRSYFRQIAPHQVGIGVQSFLNYSARDIQRIALEEFG